ncbi:hypothetical protein BD309DRAFT_1022532 [Dichomitus squalens]|nr:hypothetical protein BD309DRAFT_1022532 [Dichomitus squalens]
MPRTPPIEKQQQLLTQLAAVRQQIREDKERVERDRMEREKAEQERQAREEGVWSPPGVPRSSPKAGPSKRHHNDNDTNDNNNNKIVNIMPKRKRARTETVWAPAKKTYAECKEKRITCLFSVGCSRTRTCQACTRSKTKCTRGQRVDKTPAVAISDDEALVTPVGRSTPSKKVAPAEKMGPVPGSSSKAWGKERETMAEREERLEAEWRKEEFKRKEKEIDMATTSIEADLPFSRRVWREIIVLKTLHYAMSEIWQLREELEELWREMRLTHGAISDLARSKEGVYQEYFGRITDLLEGEPSDDKGHLDSDPDWAEMEEFGVAELDWELGSEAEQGRKQEAEKGPEQAQE